MHVQCARTHSVNNSYKDKNRAYYSDIFLYNKLFLPSGPYGPLSGGESLETRLWIFF